MAHNRILEQALAHKGVSASFSYCCGVADGLLSRVRKEMENEREEKEQETLEAREREEGLPRQREMERLAEDAGNDITSHSQAETSNSVSSDEGHDGDSSAPESPVCLDESDGLSDCSFDFDYGGGDDGNRRSMKGEGNPEVELEPDFKVDPSQTSMKKFRESSSGKGHRRSLSTASKPSLGMT